jgi:flap endonuclease-1
MGVNLKPLVRSSPIILSELSNKIMAVDAYNIIYQFLATIRGPTGELLTNNKGDVTSHLSGLFYRNINLLAENVKLIYVFDGKPHQLKLKEIEHRHQIKEEASKKYQNALSEGRFEDARKYR